MRFRYCRDDVTVARFRYCRDDITIIRFRCCRDDFIVFVLFFFTAGAVNYNYSSVQVCNDC
jgi:hypothetical protein